MISTFYDISTIHLSVEMIQRKALRVYASNKGALADSYIIKDICTFIQGRLHLQTDVHRNEDYIRHANQYMQFNILEV